MNPGKEVKEEEKPVFERLFVGGYEYLRQGRPYSQENFTVSRESKNQDYLYEAESMTRVESGEFLRIKCSYLLNSLFTPKKVMIKKDMGELLTEEMFEYNDTTKRLSYVFSAGEEKKSYIKVMSGKFQISTPTFATATLFTQSKKFDALARNQFNMVSTFNDWQFKTPFVENFIYIEYLTHEKTEIKVRDLNLSCHRCLMYNNDIAKNVTEKPSIFYISKNQGLPYKAEIPAEEVEIVVTSLKKVQAEENPFAKG